MSAASQLESILAELNKVSSQLSKLGEDVLDVPDVDNELPLSVPAIPAVIEEHRRRIRNHSFASSDF